MNVDKRLEKMRELVARSKPCHDHMFAGDIADVAADRPEYAELAGVIAALCR